MWNALVVGAVVGFLLLLVVDTWRLGAPPMPSSPAERRAAVALVGRLLGEKVESLTVLEAGAGWGGLALAVARAHPTCTVVAVEGAWVPWAWCWLRARLTALRGGPTVRVRLGRAGAVTSPPVDVVVAFLGPEITAAVANQLLAHHPGLVVISIGFTLPGWTKLARVPLGDAWRSEVALWAPPTTR